MLWRGFSICKQGGPVSEIPHFQVSGKLLLAEGRPKWATLVKIPERHGMLGSTAGGIASQHFHCNFNLASPGFCISS